MEEACIKDQSVGGAAVEAACTNEVGYFGRSQHRSVEWRICGSRDRSLQCPASLNQSGRVSERWSLGTFVSSDGSCMGIGVAEYRLMVHQSLHHQ